MDRPFEGARPIGPLLTGEMMSFNSAKEQKAKVIDTARKINSHIAEANNIDEDTFRERTREIIDQVFQTPYPDNIPSSSIAAASAYVAADGLGDKPVTLKDINDISGVSEGTIGNHAVKLENLVDLGDGDE